MKKGKRECNLWWDWYWWLDWSPF